ncbi:MAG: hypothetical protein IPL90_10735 [Holophagales bacterium]|nr:hypothetical protein [Holophagales bacterium]
MFRRLALLLALFIVTASPLSAEPVAVPGGTESIRRVLGLGGRRPPGDFFLEVNRAFLAGSSPFEAWDKNERRRAVALFAEDLAAWRAEQGCPALLSARGEAWKKTRRALTWLGFRVRGDGPGFEAEPRSGVEEERRQAFLDVLGRPVAELLRRLSAGEEVTIACGDGEAELPFGLAAWREILGADEKELNAGNAFLHFVKTVPPSRMLVALLSVDVRTREELRTLAGPPGGAGGWKLLYDEALDGFARFPEALVVRDGRIRLPGGEAADAVWEDVVGVPPSNREEFAVKLLGADSGKAAFVVDALRLLVEADARAFVLGRTGGGEAAVKRFRGLYGSIERSGGDFARSRREPYDIAHLVRFLKLADNGVVAVPGGAALWLEAIGSSRFPEDEPELSRILAEVATGKATPEGLLPRLLRREPPGSVRNVPVRKQFLVVSSLVEARPVLADAGTIVLLFRGMERLLASYAPLEELPLDDPVVVRRYLFTLNRLDTSGTGRAAELRAGLFQASIDLLAAFCRSRALPDERARTLVRSLLDVPLFAMPKLDPADGIGGFEGWLNGELVAALREEEEAFLAKARADVARRDPDGELPGPARTPDDLVAAALAGWRPPVTFAWRGGRYRFDPTSDGAARRRAFAATQEHVPLADLAEAGAEREKAIQAARTGDAEGMRASVGALMERLAAVRPPGRDEDERILWVVASVRLAFGELRHATRDDALKRLEERLGRFDALRAERTLEALAVHVYSSSVTDPTGLPYTDGLFVRRHSLSWGGPTGGETVSPFGPTRLERLGEGRGSRIGGSFSGLADTLDLLHAGELVYDARALATNEQIRAGLIAPITHMTPARLDDDALRFVALACRASEQLAEALAGRSEAGRLEAWSVLARDLVSPSRLNSLAGRASGEVADDLTPSDLFRIGRRLALGAVAGEVRVPAAVEARETWNRLVTRLGEAAASARVAELGPRPLAWAGRNRLADMDMPSYERLAEYQVPRFFAERLFDLKIAAIRAVVDAGDPAELLPLTLEPALDGLLEGMRMGYDFDWRPLAETDAALARASRDLVLERALSAGRITRADEEGTR